MNASPNKSSNSTADDQLFKQLDAPPPHIEAPAAYALSVLMSLSVLLTLPVVYLVIVAALSWLTFELLVGGFQIFWAGKGQLLTALFWFGGGIGLLLLLALLKPLVRWFIAWLRGGPKPLVLQREQEPLLYALADRLSETLDTPAPDEIRVDIGVNASAGPKSLLAGLFTQNTVLTVGLPLAAGLNVRQLVGIVAHEMGHFAQSGGGTDLTVLVRLINSWLADLTVNRDRIDEYIDALAHSRIGPLRVVFAVPYFCLIVARRVFFFLMAAGHAASCFEARQKEFDADKFEAYICGSDAFSGTTVRLRLLGTAHQLALDDLRDAWQDQRLAEDFPGLVAAKADQMPPDRRQQIARLVLTEKSAWHHTHPSDAERIAAIRGLGYAGLLDDTRPASVLFSGFGKLCRQATRLALGEMLKEEFNEAKLVPVEVMVREQQATEEAHKALRRYYQGEFVLWRPLLPDAAAAYAPDNAKQSLAALKNARKQMLAASKSVGEKLRRYDTIDTRLIQARQAQVITNAGYWVDPQDFDLEIADGSPGSVALEVNDLTDELKRIDASLQEYDKSARQRLTLALQLLHVPAAFQRMPEDSRDDDLRSAVRFVGVCKALEEVHEQVRELRMQLYGLLPFAGLDPRRIDRQLGGHVIGQCRTVAGWVENVRMSLFEIAYPFEHARGNITCADFAVPAAPQQDQVFEVMEAALTTIGRFDSLLARVLARLTLIAERVETALGFKPLQVPDEIDEFEQYVQQCELGAQLAPTLSTRMSSAARWAIQIGITTGMAALVVLGFAGFALLAQAKQSWLNEIVEPQQVASRDGDEDARAAVPPDNRQGEAPQESNNDNAAHREPADESPAGQTNPEEADAAETTVAGDAPAAPPPELNQQDIVESPGSRDRPPAGGSVAAAPAPAIVRSDRIRTQESPFEATTQPVGEPALNVVDDAVSEDNGPAAAAKPFPTAATIRLIAISAGGDHAVCADSEGKVHYFRPGDAQPRRNFVAAPGHHVGAVAIARDAARIATSAMREKTVDLWDVESGRSKRLYEEMAAEVLAFSPSGRLLAGGFEQRLLLWDAATGQLQKQLAAESFVDAISFSADEKFVLLGDRNGNVMAWDHAADRVVFREHGHDNSVRCVVLSPDTKLILSSGDDGRMIWWNASAGKQLLTKPNVRCRQCGFLPDGKYAVTYQLRRIDLWSTKTGLRAKTIPLDEAGVHVAFSADCSRLLFVEGLGHSLSDVHLWEMPQ